jgi:hypothetical protein
LDLSGALISGLISIVGYVMLFLGVHKIFQMAADIREIKETVKSARRQASVAAPRAAEAPPVLEDDSAAEYAEKLLRAVNAESGKDGEPSAEIRHPEVL